MPSHFSITNIVIPHQQLFESLSRFRTMRENLSETLLRLKKLIFLCMVLTMTRTSILWLPCWKKLNKIFQKSKQNF